MGKEREELAEAVLNHALEIICLLTVEDFIVVRPPDRTRCTFSIRPAEINSNIHGSFSSYPELLFTLQGMEGKTQKTIADLANKILRLLTRQVPVKCEDVAVYFSKEEWEYLEGHGEQYKKCQDTCTTEEPTLPVEQSAETLYPMKCRIKEEPDDGPYHTTDGTAAVPCSLSTPESIENNAVYVYIPLPEAQPEISIISSSNIKSEPGEGTSEETLDSVDEEYSQCPPSPDRGHVYSVNEHLVHINEDIKVEPEDSKDSYMSLPVDTMNADYTYQDEDYLSTETNYSKAETSSEKSLPPCEVCGKAFRSKASLDRHLQIHSGERPFPCNECGKRFSCRNHLTSHQRSHSGERPFPCDKCGRRFINHQHLVLHQVVHTREKPYSCPVCGKGFTRQSSVVKHSGMHAEKKPYVCTECGKSYCQYANLVVHQRLHSGEKPFVCKFCDKAFTCKATMLRHQKAHTGEKPFPCPQCDKSFIDNSTLTKHKRRVHSKEPKPA